MRAATSSLRFAALAAGCLMAAAGCCCVKKGFVVRADCSLEVNRVPWLTGHGPKYEECKTCSAQNGKDCAAAGKQDSDQGPGGPPAEPPPGPPGHSRLHPVPIGPVFGPATGEPVPAPRDAGSSPPEATASPSAAVPPEPNMEELRPPADETPARDRGTPSASTSRATARRTSWAFIGAGAKSAAESKLKSRPKPPVIP